MGDINPLTWISDNWDSLATRELAQICLPGCRAAGMSVLRDPSPDAARNNTLTQSLGTFDLLCAGARVLDIHPTLHGGEWFAGLHSYVNGSFQGGYGEKLDDMLEQVVEFLAAADNALGERSKELVILAFSHAFDMDHRAPPSSGELAELLGLVTGKLAGRMITSSDSMLSLAQRSLDDLLTGGNVLCLFSDVQDRLDTSTGVFSLGTAYPRSGLPVAAATLGETITAVTAPVKATDTTAGAYYRNIATRRSLDGGRSWTQFVEISDVAIKAGTVPTLTLSPGGRGLLAFVGEEDEISVLTTLDGGLTWCSAARGKTGRKTTTAPAAALSLTAFIVLAYADRDNGNLLTIVSRPPGNTGWSSPTVLDVRVADGAGPALACNPITGRLLLLYADADADGAVSARIGTMTDETISWGAALPTPGRTTLPPSIAFMPDGSIGVTLVPDQPPAVPVYMSGRNDATCWFLAGPVREQSVDAPPALIVRNGAPLLFILEKYAGKTEIIPSPSGDGSQTQRTSWRTAPVSLLLGTPQRADGPAPAWSAVDVQAHLTLYDARTTATDAGTVGAVQESHLLSYRRDYRELFCLSWVAGQSSQTEGSPRPDTDLLSAATSLNASLDNFVTTRLNSGTIQTWNRPNILLVDYFGDPDLPLDRSVVETALTLGTCTPDVSLWPAYAVPPGALTPQSQTRTNNLEAE